MKGWKEKKKENAILKLLHFCDEKNLSMNLYL